MATWKLVSGIISIISTILVLFQSCFAGVGGALMEIGGAKESFAGTAGTLVALLMMSGGITSIATRNSETNGGNKALIGLFGLATLICLASMTGIYKDLIVWGIWCAINAGMAFKDMREKDGTAGRPQCAPGTRSGRSGAAPDLRCGCRDRAGGKYGCIHSGHRNAGKHRSM